MHVHKQLIYPIIFLAILAPVFIVALLTYDPGTCPTCDCAALPAGAHTHGAGLAVTVKDDMQLVFNVTPGADLYQIVDGKLELCAPVEGEPTEIKHVTLDVIDARIMPGERLPVQVSIEIRDAQSGAVVVRADAPATMSAGHGYHFGENFRLPNDAAYAWTVTVSAVNVLRMAGAESVWLEPVEWSGEFRLDAEGRVVDVPPSVQPIGDFSRGGLHVALGTLPAQTLYAVTDGISAPQDAGPNARYFVVDITDHTVNYEEKLPGAAVTLTFTQGPAEFKIPLEPVIGPLLGFHYGANVALEPGEWTITVTVSGLDFLRHAGAAVNLGRSPVRGEFTYSVP